MATKATNYVYEIVSPTEAESIRDEYGVEPWFKAVMDAHMLKMDRLPRMTRSQEEALVRNGLARAFKRVAEGGVYVWLERTEDDEEDATDDEAMPEPPDEEAI